MPISKELVRELLAGGVSGMVGLFVTYPIDTIKTFQQVSSKPLTMRQASSLIWRKAGFRGFYRGMMIPMLTNGGVFAAFFATYGAALEYFAAQDDRLKNNQGKSIEDLASYEEIFYAGCAGGFTQSLFAGPVELIKVQMQIDRHNVRPSAVASVKKILKYRGYRGLGMGMSATFLRDIHSHGVYMVAYKMYMDLLCTPLKNSDLTSNSDLKETCCMFMAGGIAGLLYWWSCIPMDVIKSRMQGDSIRYPEFKNTLNCVVKTYQEGGIKPFFKGTYATTFRAFPANGCIFLAHKFVVTHFDYTFG